MVHRREIEGTEIVLGNQGALFQNAMTWWDHDTGSIWSQPIGEAILGPRRGETLELLPSTLTTWSGWQAEHPETLALDVVDSNRNFRLIDTAIVVELGDDSAAFEVPAVRQVGVVNDVIGDIAIAVIVARDTDDWAVFSRTVGDAVIELALVDGVVIEVGGTRQWDPVRGIAVGGTDTDNLALLPAFTSFSDDYTNFFPDGRIWDGG